METFGERKGKEEAERLERVREVRREKRLRDEDRHLEEREVEDRSRGGTWQGQKYVWGLETTGRGGGMLKELNGG